MHFVHGITVPDPTQLDSTLVKDIQKFTIEKQLTESFCRVSVVSHTAAPKMQAETLSEALHPRCCPRSCDNSHDPI